MYSKAARYYDKLYAKKDYQGEADKLLAFVREKHPDPIDRWLDVACGTGVHIQHLKSYFQIEGLDVCQELLQFARQRNPEVTFHYGDMTDFHLSRRYDVISCLFSAIGYVKTLSKLHAAAACLAHHLNPGGLLIVEPWFTPQTWQPNTVHALFIDEPELKIARINTSQVEGSLSVFDLHHLVGTPQGTEYILEHHELGLFTEDEMTSALQAAGLVTAYDPQGLTGRGLYFGRRSQ